MPSLLRALLPALVTLAACTTAAGDSQTTPAGDAPLVIELFTSQGCSSCPPAEALLNKLAHAGQLGGRTLAPLAFHVDYWDDLGWPDPYASAAWTERQREYAAALSDHRIYTPELVVAGRTGMVGSHATAVTQAIAAAPRQQRITAAATWSAKAVTVTATAPAHASIYVAIWQDGTSIKVPRGENAGETLAADRVVRKLVLVAAAGTAGSRTIELERSWRPGGAVAFAQQADRTIVGAALLPLPK